MTISTQSSTTLNKSFLRRILQAFIDIRELTLIVLITAIIIVMSNINPYFFSFPNSFLACPFSLQ